MPTTKPLNTDSSQLNGGSDERLIAPIDAELNASAEASSPSDPKVLRNLYANLLACRMVAERGLSLSPQEASDSRDSKVSDAVVVGATFELRPADSVASQNHDALLNFLSRVTFSQPGCDPGRDEPRSDGEPKKTRGWHLLPRASHVGAQLNIAAGVSLAQKQQGQRNVVLALCGDGKTALGLWHDTAKLAAERRLPIIFVIESRMRPAAPRWVAEIEDLSQRAHTYGFPGITVDGDDVVAIFRVAQESIHRARSGTGPTLIECKSTWTGESAPELSKNGGHSKNASAKLHSPLTRMEHYLKKRKAWSDSWRRDLMMQIATKIHAAAKAN